jgi:hypothetical protein
MLEALTQTIAWNRMGLPQEDSMSRIARTSDRSDEASHDAMKEEK